MWLTTTKGEKIHSKGQSETYLKQKTINLSLVINHKHKKCLLQHVIVKLQDLL